jgi:hypothetical protein
MTTKVSDVGGGSVGSLAIGRESVPADGPDYRRIEGGYEEPNISTEPE